VPGGLLRSQTAVPIALLNGKPGVPGLTRSDYRPLLEVRHIAQPVEKPSRPAAQACLPAWRGERGDDLIGG
jgi:hypothetical protein